MINSERNEKNCINSRNIVLTIRSLRLSVKHLILLYKSSNVTKLVENFVFK
jgi:hypothetical protein